MEQDVGHLCRAGRRSIVLAHEGRACKLLNGVMGGTVAPGCLDGGAFRHSRGERLARVISHAAHVFAQLRAEGKK